VFHDFHYDQMKGDEMGGNVTHFCEEVIQSYDEKILREVSED